MAKSKIIKELANSEISIETALNRLLIIASDLDNQDLAIWAELELQGYGAKDPLPSYRQLKSAQFTYSGINGSFQVNNIPFTCLHLITEHDPDAINVRIKDSVSVLQDFITNSESQSYCRDYTYLSDYIYQETGIQCTHLLQRIPLNHLQNIISEIKTRLLKIFLKLDKEYGSLDNLDIDTSSKRPEEIAKINQVVNNYIYVNNSVRIGDQNKISNSQVGGGK